MDTQLYEIVRFYHPRLVKESEVIKEDVTLEEAQEWCNDPETREEGWSFDGYRRQE